MQLPAHKAAPILDLVSDTAIRRAMTRWAVVMYSRTLCGSPTRLALEALFRRWSALAANSRIKALRSPFVLNGTETMRMSPAMVLDDDRYHGVATHLAGECVGRTTDRTIDLARTNLDDWGAAVYEARGKLLAHLREVLYTLDAGASELAEPRAGGVCDAEFADRRDGSDIDRFLDDAVRAVCAGVAIAHTVIDKEAPR